MESLEVNDNAAKAGNSRWTQTTLYDLIDCIGKDPCSGEAHFIEGIMLDLGNKGRLRRSQQGARIKFVLLD